MFNQIGGLNAIGAPLSPNQIGGENFIRHIGNDKLIFDFHEGSGTVCYDKSHCGNNGTLINPTDITWKRNELQFGGTSGYVETIQNLGVSGASPWFIGIWFKVVNNVQNGTIISIGIATDSNIFAPQQATDNDKFFLNYWSAENEVTATTGIDLRKGYNHIGISFDSTNIKLYINGGLFHTDPFPLNITNNPVRISGRPGGYDGQYGENIFKKVKIKNRVLSQIEIQQEYLANKFRGNN